MADKTGTAESDTGEKVVSLERWELAAGFESLDDPLPPKHVVFVLHGIWSRGRWFQFANYVFNEYTGVIRIERLDYGLSGLWQFLFSLDLNRRGEYIVDQVADYLGSFDTANTTVSFMAHSFGSQMLFQVIERIARTVSIKYIVLFGSIVRPTMVRPHLRKCQRIINQCGTRDIVPILAESVRPCKYNATGTYGINLPHVANRFFNVGHFGCTSIAHLKQHIVPIFINNQLRGDAADVAHMTPHAVLIARLLGIALIAAAVVGAVL
jgi:hypothetical protein